MSRCSFWKYTLSSQNVLFLIYLYMNCSLFNHHYITFFSIQTTEQFAMVINLENVILKINFMYFIFNTRKGNTIVIIKQFKILFAYHIYDIHCTLIWKVRRCQRGNQSPNLKTNKHCNGQKKQDNDKQWSRKHLAKKNKNKNKQKNKKQLNMEWLTKTEGDCVHLSLWVWNKGYHILS
jgi:hypothetical protein